MQELNTPLLDSIKSPKDLRKLPVDELKFVCQELREYIEQNSMDTKTNLNSNLQLRRGKNTEEVENEKLILNSYVFFTSLKIENG